VCVPEVYEAANPNATVANMVFEAKQRGAALIVPVFQLYIEDHSSRSYLDRFLNEVEGRS
jgi:hypothetical protein